MTEHKKWCKKLIRDEILGMDAYQVQPAHGLIKLDVMENPYNLSETLKDEWLARLRQVEINRYPDASAQRLNQALLAQLDLPDEFGVILGNGSDELIQIIIQSLAEHAGPVLSVTPSFVMFKVLSQIVGKSYIDVPLNADFSLDLVHFLAQIDQYQPACIFLAYPNNPTGNLFEQEQLRAIIERTPGLVIIDEAYMPFAGVTLVDWLVEYPNLLVMRTLSKAGLAGLRFGMLYGHESWLEELNKIRLPFNINSLTQVSVEFALDHYEFFQKNAQRIVEERGRVFRQLQSMPALEAFKSDANFILFRSLEMDARQVFDELLARNILIKCVHTPGTLLDQCLRVTIGTEDENNFFLDSMRDILKESP